MDYHHVIEAAGIVIIGLVVYSYICRWFEPVGRLDRRWRVLVSGLLLGGLSVVLMIARIQVSEGVFIDARAVPLALLGLFEGGVALVVAALLPSLYRTWLGGSGVVGGLVGIWGTVLAAWLVHRWARRQGPVTTVHALMLSLLVFGVSAASFLVLGQRGLALFEPLWFPLFMTLLVGIGLLSRLFADVAQGEAAEAARREAAELRAVTLLARAAAHEINNPLNVVIGGLTIVGRRHPEGTEDADWITRATEGARQIKDIVARMNRITAVRTTEGQGAAPAMLDVRRSSSDAP